MSEFVFIASVAILSMAICLHASMWLIVEMIAS